MPRQKTQTLAGNLIRYRLDELEGQVRKRMRSYQGSAPEDLRRALLVLILCHDAPDTVLSPAARVLRDDLAELVVKFPVYVLAALLWIHRQPRKSKKPGPSHSSIIREYLLTTSDAILPGGRSVLVLDATDDDLSLAIADHHWRATGQRVSISEQEVKDERRRLQSKYGEPIGYLMEVLLGRHDDPSTLASKAKLRRLLTDACRSRS